MSGTSLHARLAQAVGDRTYRAVSELTGAHPETVRRYLQGGPPSAEFLAALCAALEINGHWLLLGHGPMRRTDIVRHALGEASPAELIAAFAASIAGVEARLGRIERVAERFEEVLALVATGVPAPRFTDATVPEPTTEADARERAQRIADAVAKRARPDAR